MDTELIYKTLGSLAALGFVGVFAGLMAFASDDMRMSFKTARRWSIVVRSSMTCVVASSVGMVLTAIWSS